MLVFFTISENLKEDSFQILQGWVLQTCYIFCYLNDLSRTQNYFFCVSGRHRSATGNISVNKLSKDSKVLFGHCLICHGEKSMIPSANTVAAEGLGDFLRSLGKQGVSATKRMAKNVLQKNAGRVLEISRNIVTAFASRSPKRTLS